MKGYEALTEKEKQTLRLLLAGHDAKSLARHFDLSVHTINERLREARRKLSVSSSREAARLLCEREQATPEKLGDVPLGDAAPAAPVQMPGQPLVAPPASRRALRVIGGFAMLLMLAAATLALLPSIEAPASSPPIQALAETAASHAADDFLLLCDAGKWKESYAATTQAFRRANTLAAWRAASEQARAPLGRALSRTLIDEHDTPARPNGLRTVRFHTDFANKHDASETLSLVRENGAWKVAGIYIE